MVHNTSFIEKVRACAGRVAEAGTPALTELFDLTAHRLVRFATSITRHQQDAEDAVQSALLTVANRPRLLAAADQPWHYLLRMVRNDALRILRRRKSAAPIGNAVVDFLTTDFDDSLEKMDQKQAVWMAMKSLPQRQCEVIVLKIWEELTFAEIGAVLEISPATAASRYRYAIEKLTQKLTSNQYEAAK